MGRMIIDATASLDGFWADPFGQSVVRTDDLPELQFSRCTPDICGAVVMSRRSFELSGDMGRIGEGYAAQAPVFVVTDVPTAVLPRDTGSRFQFVETYAAAFSAARVCAGDKAVLVVGEGGAFKAAMRTGEADEIWLRMLSRTAGQGTPLFEGIPVENYFVSEMETTPDAVHMHLERRFAD